MEEPDNAAREAQSAAILQAYPQGLTVKQAAKLMDVSERTFEPSMKQSLR